MSLSFALGTTKGLDRDSDRMVPRNVLIHQAGENQKIINIFFCSEKNTVMAHFSVKNSIRGFVIFQIKQAAVITEHQNTPDI